METYEYVVLSQRGTAIEIQSTDPSTIHQLFGVLSRSIEGFGVSASKLPTSRIFYWRLYGFADELERAWQIIADYLVVRDWQPLEEPVPAGAGGGQVLCFGTGGDESGDPWSTWADAAG
jgi:hypothetical protein